MQEREPKDIQQVIARYHAAVESLQKVAHYVDKVVMGRAATASEMATFTERRGAMESAFRKVCLFPCPDLATLRAKAKFLNVYLAENSLGRHDARAFVQSILQMPK